MSDHPENDPHLPHLNHPIVLVGMMGAGKSAIGRIVAPKMGLNFVDADTEIEHAAAMTISEIFEEYGEEHFRDREFMVIKRLLENPKNLIATGGGAFIQDKTRALILEEGLSVWLDADFDTLWERVSRKDTRPLLKTPDPQGTLRTLIEARYPVYKHAHITVKSEAIPKDAMADRIINAVAHHTKG